MSVHEPLVPEDEMKPPSGPDGLRVVAGRSHEPLRARIPDEMKPARFESALPAIDLVAALLLGALILRPITAAIVYCVAAVPFIGFIEGYSRAAIGGRESLRSVARLTLAAIVCQWSAFMVIAPDNGHLPFGRASALLLASVAAWSLARALLARFEKHRPQRVVVVGSGYVTERLMEVIGNHTRGRMEVLGYVDNTYVGNAHPGLAQLGVVAHLADVVQEHAVDRVLVAFSAHHTDQQMLSALRACDELPVQIDVVPRLFEFIGTSRHSYTLGSVPLLAVRGRDRRLVTRCAKRTTDVVVSAAGLVVLSPILALTAAAIWLEDRGPVIFRQARVGRNGAPFSVFKFRSMSQDADRLDSSTIVAARGGITNIADAVAAIKQTSDQRVTRVGGFIRKTSLDELPQLLNVLRGEMSLVGPRPLRAFEVESLSEWQLTRQLERPGLTGLWQVTGRSATSWDERMQLDYSYVRHWSFSEDLQILARTMPAVITRDGAW